MQKIQGKVRKTLEDYNMIEDGDKVAVGLSGGKDSLTLLTALASLRRYYPKKFEIVAIIVDMYGGESDFSAVLEYCKSLNVECTVVPSEIYKILFEIRKEKSPCSLCARMRRGILAEAAEKLQCNKVALGHHANDLIETFFLSLFYESRLSVFTPVTNLSRSGITVIRPMITVWEKETVKAAENMPVFINNCPANKHTQREEIKNILLGISSKIHQMYPHILSALLHPERNHLIDKNLYVSNEENEV